MAGPTFLLKGRRPFVRLGSREFPLPDGLTPGGKQLLNHLAASPMVPYDTATITGSNGMRVKRDTAKRWIRSTRAYLDRARSADLPEEVRELLDRFVLTPGGGPRVPSTAEYVPPTLPEVPALVDAPEVLTLRGTSLRLRYVPGGAYLRGRPSTQHTDERPAHRVRLSPFLLGEWPVSNGQYEAFLREFASALSAPDADVRSRAEAFCDELRAVWIDGARWARDDARTPNDLAWGAPTAERPYGLLERLRHGRWAPPDWRPADAQADAAALAEAAARPSAPAVGVDWLCVQAWLRWYRLELPPEAVWEFAALGAQRPDTTSRRAAVPSVGGVDHTPASTLGFRGMLGYGWQWCADWYDLYPQDDGAPAVWDPRGPPDPPTRGGQRALPYRVLRGGSWERAGAQVGPHTRGGNYQQWRAIWDTFRPYAPLRYRFLAWQFGLPEQLESEALARREELLDRLDPRRDDKDHRNPRADFEAAVAERAAPEAREGCTSQASLVALTGEVRRHHVKRPWAHQIPGLPQILAGVTAGAQSGPTGSFAWIDRLNVVGETVERPRLSFCAWSRVPGLDAWLIVESHADLDPATFPHDHEVFGWLRRAGWDDRRWLGAAR